jgi:hypothetical protein
MTLIIKIISNDQDLVKKSLLNHEDYDCYSIVEDDSMFAMELKKPKVNLDPTDTINIK